MYKGGNWVDNISNMSNFPYGYHLHTMGWSTHELVAMFIYDYINL